MLPTSAAWMSLSRIYPGHGLLPRETRLNNICFSLSLSSNQSYSITEAFALPLFTSQPHLPWESNMRDTWYTHSQLRRMLLYNKYMTGMCGKHAATEAVNNTTTKCWLPAKKETGLKKKMLLIISETQADEIFSSGISRLNVQFVNTLLLNLQLCVRSLCIPSPVLPVRWLLSIISSGCGNPFSGSVNPTKGLIES